MILFWVYFIIFAIIMFYIGFQRAFAFYGQKDYFSVSDENEVVLKGELWVDEMTKTLVNIAKSLKDFADIFESKYDSIPKDHILDIFAIAAYQASLIFSTQQILDKVNVKKLTKMIAKKGYTEATLKYIKSESIITMYALADVIDTIKYKLDKDDFVNLYSNEILKEAQDRAVAKFKAEIGAPL